MPSPINCYFAELAEAVERSLLAAGYLLSIGITHEDSARELVHVRSLIDRRVDGLMVTSSGALARWGADQWRWRARRLRSAVLDRPSAEFA